MQLVWASRPSAKGKLSKKGLTLGTVTGLHCLDGAVKIDAVSLLHTNIAAGGVDVLGNNVSSFAIIRGITVSRNSRLSRSKFIEMKSYDLVSDVGVGKHESWCFLQQMVFVPLERRRGLSECV